MMVGLVRMILRAATLLPVPELRPLSFVHYAAVREFRSTGSLEAAAVLLGVADLNAVAVVVGYDWRAEHAIAPDWTGTQ